MVALYLVVTNHCTIAMFFRPCFWSISPQGVEKSVVALYLTFMTSLSTIHCTTDCFCPFSVHFPAGCGEERGGAARSGPRAGGHRQAVCVQCPVASRLQLCAALCAMCRRLLVTIHLALRLHYQASPAHLPGVLSAAMAALLPGFFSGC